MWELFDPYLMALYRITGADGLDGLIGTFLIALLACVIGEFTISIAFRVNRKHLDKLNNELVKYNDLSLKARECGDEVSYRALNKQANDAHGQVFFNRVGLSAASLWPAFFALDWIQRPFGQTGIPVPFHQSGINYFFVFLLSYILARVVFGRLKRHLPYFKGEYAMLLAYGKKSG
ncbi:MAG: hypothetical protein AB9866_11785 [Syntrophobacteraceae bacterium]